jgi:hypothetical protein
MCIHTSKRILIVDFGRLQGEVEVFMFWEVLQLRLVVSYRRFGPIRCTETSETTH